MSFDARWVKATKQGFYLKVKNIKSIEQLRNISYSGIKPGPALVNEIAYLTKNSSFGITESTKLIMFLLESYLQVFDATRKVIRREKIQKMYVYNGRFLHERAVWDASKFQKIKCILFETIRDRYILDTRGFHDRINSQKNMKKHWNFSNLDHREKIKIGSEYFINLESRLNQFFRDGEKKFLSNSEKYFVYFSSSDDEYAGLDKKWSSVLGHQIECIRKLQNIFQNQSNAKLVIRIHPNLINKSKKERDRWESIKPSKNSLIIQSNSSISSYKLLKGSLGVITFGSTIGLEAAYWGKTCLVLRNCGYDLLGVCNNARKWSDVENWIESGYKLSSNEVTLRKINSCIRGYYLATAGIKFKYTEIKESKTSGSWEAIEHSGFKFEECLLIELYRKILFKLRNFVFLVRTGLIFSR
jgi:hypothetical protein